MAISRQIMTSGSAITRDIRPLAPALFVWGMFPSRIADDGLRFSNLSLLSTVSLIMAIAPAIIIFSIIVTFFSNGRKITFSFYVFQTIVRSIINITTFKHISDLVTFITAADRLLTSQPSTINRYSWFFISLSLNIFYVTLAYCITGTSSLTNILTRPLAALLWGKDAQQVVLFFFFVHQLKQRFIIVTTMTDVPERARLAHASLVKCVRTLSKAFEIRFFISIVAVGSDYLCNVYINTYLKAEASISIIIFGLLDAIFVIIIPATLSAVLVEQGYNIREHLLEIHTSDKTNSFCQQIELFLEEVRTTNLEISAWGVFTVDSDMYGAFVNTLLTFFIAMAQFSKEITVMIDRYSLEDQ